MASQFWIILVPLVAILANMAAQVAVYRLWNTEGRLFRSQMAGAVTGLAVLVVLSVSVRGPGTSAADSATANALIYLAFCYVYFHWNNMGETARRIRLLRELYDTPQGLTDAELHARYPAREILEHRLRRLIEARQIAERDSRLFLTGTAVLRSARLVGLAKWLIIGGRSELADHDHFTL
ncbi:MAG: hypothetical protein V3R22_01860 [Kiloniellales bacterium]